VRRDDRASLPGLDRLGNGLRVGAAQQALQRLAGSRLATTIPGADDGVMAIGPQQERGQAFEVFGPQFDEVQVWFGYGGHSLLLLETVVITFRLKYRINHVIVARRLQRQLRIVPRAHWRRLVALAHISGNLLGDDGDAVDAGPAE